MRTRRLTGEQLQRILLGAGPDSYSYPDAAVAIGSYTSYTVHRDQWASSWADLSDREREVVAAILKANRIVVPWEQADE